MFCTHCGKPLKPQNRFCENCGNPISFSNTEIEKKEHRNNGLMYILFIVALLIIGTLSFALYKKLNPKENTRTVMIYMVGSDLESKSGIASAELDAIDPNLVDLENVNILLYTGGTEKWHNFISSDENAIYLLKKEGFEKLESLPQDNMGDSKTFQSFLDYGYKNFKASKYDLILYDHGAATDGAIIDDYSSDLLSLSDFKEALKNSHFKKNNKLETVFFRTCLNGTLEVANVFKEHANYLVASEEITNGKTPYSILSFLNNVKKEDNTIEMNKKFIAAYQEQMANIDYFNQINSMYSIVDLGKVDKINKELNKFVEGIDLANNYSDLVRVRNGLFQYAYTQYNNAEYDMVDLYTLVERITPYSKESGKNLLNAINEAVVYNWTNLDESHGISIFFPYRASKITMNKKLYYYPSYSNNSSYLTFITSFNQLSTSNNESSFSNFNAKETKQELINNDFTLELTEEQARDYAGSIYIVFEKQENGKYAAIYSSDNTELENNLLKTNIADNLIKVYDTSDLNDKGTLISTIERTSNNKRTISTPGVLWSFGNDFSFESQTANLYFDFDNDRPFIYNVVKTDTEKLASSGEILDINNYEVLDMVRSEYVITDENGNYTENWDNEGIITLIKINVNNLKFEKASLEDEDYYCVFKITDIYGNYYYSNLKSMRE